MISLILFISTLFILDVVCMQQNAVPEKAIVGYWGYWESKLLPIDHIPWSQITHINYGFASVNEGVEPILTNEAQLIRMVGIAHQHNVKALLSIGGWLGSRSMSSVAATHENRTMFVNRVVGWVLDYGLDGLDIDWEHPGKSALECNTIDYANDADNYLLLLQELRESLDNAFSTIRMTANLQNSTVGATDNGHKLLTAAVGTTPFFKNNAPIADTSHYAQVLDWIFIMMYDTYVGKSVIGPNAPLQTSMQAGASPQSFAQAWNAWTSAHMPANQIVMGLPFYGYVAKPKEDVVALKRLLATAHASRPQGDPDDDMSAPSCPGVRRRGYSGLWKWRSLYTSGALLDAKTPGGQWIKNWDQESQTPWLYNPVTKHLISYDDPDSISIKVNFALCVNARGVGIWDLAYDAYDSQGTGELLTVVNQQISNSASKKEAACQKLNPVAAYKLVGPHFNALPMDRVLSKSQRLGFDMCTSSVLGLILCFLLK